MHSNAKYRGTLVEKHSSVLQYFSNVHVYFIRWQIFWFMSATRMQLRMETRY